MRSVRKGFTLPTVVVASVAMLAMLLMSFQLSAASSNALRSQYYQQLSNTAAEAGVARATECIEQNNGTAGWSSANPLTASTDCQGVVRAECSVSTPSGSCFVVYTDSIRTNYKISSPVVSGSGYSLSAIGSVGQLSPSNTTTTLAASGSASYISTISNAPKITGGAGWEGYGHIGMFISINGKLFAYGENSDGQITNSYSDPDQVPKPTEIPLPAGVNSIKVAKTSGQGASFICVIGDNDRAYCRGSAGYALLDGRQWHEFAVNSSWKVYNITLNGYGGDTICVLAGASASTKKIYCAGSQDYGQLGNGSSDGTIFIPLSAPEQFGKGSSIASLNFDTLYDTNSFLTCAKEVNGTLYCAGFGSNGLVGRTTTEDVKVPINWGLPSMGTVLRTPLDVVSDYHDITALHVLATDGTIWTRGYRDAFAHFGSGLKTGSTGTNAFPDWFGPRGGMLTHSSGKCLDIDSGSNTNSAKVQLWDCNSSAAQKFFITDDTGNGSAIFFPTSSNNTSNKCIDLDGENVNNYIHLWDCTDNNPAQQWLVGSDGRIRYKGNPNLCLYPVGGTSNGSRFKLQTCSTSTNQVFTISEDAKPYKAMIAGNNFFCGVKENSARCGGNNDYGQLMNYVSASQRDGNMWQDTASTWQVQLPPNETIDVDKLVAGGYEWKYQYNSLQVITRSGKVYGAGVNEFGKLGKGTLSGIGVGSGCPNSSLCECPMSTICNKEGATQLMQLPAGVKAVDMSTRDEYTTYVLGNNGNVYASGWNSNGQLGTGALAPSYSTTPVRILLDREGYLY